MIQEQDCMVKNSFLLSDSSLTSFLIISFHFLFLPSISCFVLSSSNLKPMVEMNTITKPPWPDPLSLAPLQATTITGHTASHLTKPYACILSVFSMGHGSIASRGCIKSGVDHGKFGVGHGLWVSQVRCGSWVVGLSSPAWVMMG